MLQVLLWSVVAAYAGHRALVRPFRAVVVDGVLARCSGTEGCDADLVVRTAQDQRVLTPASGRVILASGGKVLIAVAMEPVLLDLSGLRPIAVTLGQHVRAGETVGTASEVSFSVRQIERDAQGRLTTRALVPSAWLASRGMSVSGKRRASGLWCGQGRRLTVPSTVAKCNMRLPEPAGLSLLPVSVQMQ